MTDKNPSTPDPLGPQTGHPGWDSLLRHHLGELPPDQEARVAGHAAECSVCAARLETLRAGDSRFRNERPFAVLEASLRKRRDAQGGPDKLDRGLPTPRWLGPVLGGLLAAAAGVYVFLQAPEPAGGPSRVGGPMATDRDPAGARERLKAGVALTFDVERGGQATPGDPAALYRAGDRIQLRYSAPAPMNVVVIGLDMRGEVSVYVDDAGAGLPVEPGAGRPLPGSLVLDAAPGAERVIACFTESPLTSNAVVAAGRRALTAAGGDPRAARPLDLPCVQADFLLNKE
ncbi:DUF4384 domain-containing protein [Myxococcota bacterium]|nr:DUF4384 domain-containing protein [Myxococcota bacterium]